MALKIVAFTGRQWLQKTIARELFLPESEVSGAIKRLSESRLFNAAEQRVIRANLAEFLLYGVPYVFAGKLGILQIGVPTASSAMPLVGKLVVDLENPEDVVVWPSRSSAAIPREKTLRGRALAPLYPRAPEAALADPKLYELLALVDALRIGRARERKLAREELAARLAP